MHEFLVELGHIGERLSEQRIGIGRQRVCICVCSQCERIGIGCQRVCVCFGCCGIDDIHDRYRRRAG